MRRGMPDDHRVEVPGRGPISLDWLRERVFRFSRGQTLAYVTDAADHPANRAKIIRLAAGADHLFIEAAFLHRDRALADATRHLTARAAGEIARRPVWAASRRSIFRVATSRGQRKLPKNSLKRSTHRERNPRRSARRSTCSEVPTRSPTGAGLWGCRTRRGRSARWQFGAATGEGCFADSDAAVTRRDHRTGWCEPNCPAISTSEGDI